MELGKDSKNKRAFTSALREALGSKGNVTELVPKATLEIRDLDGATDEEDVRDALQQALQDGIGAPKIRVPTTVWRGQKIALIDLDEARAAELLKTSRIKIGWVNCRVKRRVVVTRCFKCLGYGHQATSCSGPDRSRHCYKCGEEGHKAATCQAKPRCVLCAAEKDDKNDLAHIPGTGACTAFRRALEQAKRDNR